MSLHQQLFQLTKRHRLEELQSLLAAHPDLDINQKDLIGWAPLHYASASGRPELVKLFLAHPAINVNAQLESGRTALVIACNSKHPSIVQLLLKDFRVDTSLADEDNGTPLWYAARNGDSDLITWLIVSGRSLGDVSAKATYLDNKYTACEIAWRDTAVVSLVESYLANPGRTRHGLRVKLRQLEALVADVFALTVFLCDDLLQLKPLATISSNPVAGAAFRFFTMASKLPMELQMVLCHQVIGSSRQNILRQDSEGAFKWLAMALLLE